jgi:Chaperone of endosialidase
VAQLGAGLVGAGAVTWPNVIDTVQTFENGSSPAPDSASRLDAEVINDILRTLRNLETGLGANPMGTFGSVAARLNQFLPGSGGLPGVFTFTNTMTVTILGSNHNVGQAALLWQLYDANIPARAMEAGAASVRVDPATYDVTLEFTTQTSGMVALGATSPLYLAPFTTATAVSVLGATHALGTADIIFKVYVDDGSGLLTAIDAGALTVHPTTFDVLMTFTVPLTGLLVLSAGGPTYALNFTLTTPPYTFTIPGSTHLLATRALFFQAYSSASPRAAIGAPAVSVNPTTFDTIVTFSAAATGRFVLAAASTLSGQDFDIRNAGVVNKNAVRIHSSENNLFLQAGAGDRVAIINKTGGPSVTINTFTNALGIGIADPTHTLELADNDAVMPGGGPWLSPSDARQKEAVQPFLDGLDVLLHLDPVRFQYNGLGGMPRTGQSHVGLVAQAVQALAPYLVRSHRGRLRPEDPETDLLTLNQGPLVFVLLNAVKTLHAWLLDARHGQQRLEQQLALLAARVAALAPEEAAS